jgi:hypothetical protein
MSAPTMKRQTTAPPSSSYIMSPGQPTPPRTRTSEKLKGDAPRSPNLDDPDSHKGPNDSPLDKDKAQDADTGDPDAITNLKSPTNAMAKPLTTPVKTPYVAIALHITDYFFTQRLQVPTQNLYTCRLNC